MNDAARIALGIIAAVLVASLYSWLSSRRLPALREDPGFAERVHKHRAHSRMVAMFGGVGIAAAVAAYWRISVGAYSIALLVCAAFAAMSACRLAELPALRRIHGDSGPLLRTIGDELRVFAAFRVFGLCLLIAPYAIAAAGWLDWLVALVMLSTWSLMRVGILWRVLDAEDHDAPNLRAIDAGATCPRPRIGVFGCAYGGMANALAFDAKPEPRVLFGRRALREMVPDEVAAIYAHEVAHLEEPEVFRMRQLRKLMFAVLILAVVPPLVLARIDASWLAIYLWGWLLVVVALGAWIGRRSQHVESGCDARAVALGADPEALASGLVALYRINLLPRRLASSADQNASHPSLARRLRDIRAIGSPEAIERPESALRLVDSRKPHRSVELRADGVTWHDQRRDKLEQLAYDDLVELRLLPSRGGMVLRGVDRKSKRRELRIAADQVEATQRYLDSVDASITYERKSRGLSFARFCGAVGALGTIVVLTNYATLELIVLPLVAVLAMITGRADGIAAGGAVLIALCAVLESLPGVVTHSFEVRVAWLAALALGGVALVLALRSRSDDASHRTASVFLAMTVIVALVQAVPMFDGGVARELYALAVGGGAAFVLAAGAGVACLMRRRAGWIAIGVGCFLFGVSRYPLRSIPFLRDVVGDPFVAANAPEVTSRPAVIVMDVTVPVRLEALAFDPDGGQVSAWQQSDSVSDSEFDVPTICRIRADGSYDFDGVADLPEEDAPVVALEHESGWAGWFRHAWAMDVFVTRADGVDLPIATTPLWVGPLVAARPDAPAGLIAWGSDFSSFCTVDRESGEVEAHARFGRLHAASLGGSRFCAVHPEGVLTFDYVTGVAELWTLPFELDWSAEIVAHGGQVVIMVPAERGTQSRLIWVE